LREGEIQAQAFARLELDRLDHRSTVSAFASGKPGKRAFGVVDHDRRPIRLLR
jgi:hypothetical protein